MDYLQQLIQRYPQLESTKNEINSVFGIIAESFKRDCKLLIAGNGGSAADAEHIIGELMKNFVKKGNSGTAPACIPLPLPYA
jgi:D-sedoheptulose 7-phosphate isomerase